MKLLRSETEADGSLTIYGEDEEGLVWCYRNCTITGYDDKGTLSFRSVLDVPLTFVTYEFKEN